MNYKDYQNTRDTAWRILLDCKLAKLPIDLNTVCRNLGAKAISYQTHWPDGEIPPFAKLTDGMTFYSRDRPIILFDQDKPSGRIRFTVAHELGHLVLGHVAPGQVTAINREPAKNDSPLETAANQFAARLLAPACVLWAVGAQTAEEISELCHISYLAAEYRSDRMKILYKRNKFFVSQLERDVYDQFRPFIEEYLSARL
ncbi:MAG: ImmA/IrrE family metallo-endopeptidase [Lawsonibacter sp.]